MPNPAKLRRYHPGVERLESHCLMSTTTVNLLPTQVGKDAYNVLAQSSPHFARTNIQLNVLTADSSTGTIRGLATESFGVKFLGTVKGTIQFATSVTNPQVGDVKFSISHVSSFLPASEKKKIALAVVKLITKDQAAIEALMPTTS